MKAKIYAASALLATFSVAGCGSSDDRKEPTAEASSKTFNVSGTATVWAPYVSASGNTEGDVCHGSMEFASLDSGAQIIVRDGAGKKVGLSELGVGFLKAGPGGLTTCEFQLNVSKVPEVDGILTVQVGDSEEVSFKRADAQQLELTFGD